MVITAKKLMVSMPSTTATTTRQRAQMQPLHNKKGLMVMATTRQRVQMQLLHNKKVMVGIMAMTRQQVLLLP